MLRRSCLGACSQCRPRTLGTLTSRIVERCLVRYALSAVRGVRMCACVRACVYSYVHSYVCVRVYMYAYMDAVDKYDFKRLLWTYSDMLTY